MLRYPVLPSIRNQNTATLPVNSILNPAHRVSTACSIFYHGISDVFRQNHISIAAVPLIA